MTAWGDPAAGVGLSFAYHDSVSCVAASNDVSSEEKAFKITGARSPSPACIRFGSLPKWPSLHGVAAPSRDAGASSSSLANPLCAGFEKDRSRCASSQTRLSKLSDRSRVSNSTCRLAADAASQGPNCRSVVGMSVWIRRPVSSASSAIPWRKRPLSRTSRGPLGVASHFPQLRSAIKFMSRAASIAWTWTNRTSSAMSEEAISGSPIMGASWLRSWGTAMAGAENVTAL